MEQNPLFVTCIPGLESLLMSEIEAIGYASKEGRGGAYVTDTGMEAIEALNYRLRMAHRVLLPLTSFSCKNKKELYEGALEVDWTLYFTTPGCNPSSRGRGRWWSSSGHRDEAGFVNRGEKGGALDGRQRSMSSGRWAAIRGKKGWTLAVDVNGTTRELQNTQFSAQVVKDGVCDRLMKVWGRRPSVDRKNPDVQLNLYIHRDRAVLYYDTSRIPLYKRGYRRESVQAPIQESLAAAMLRMAGYTGEETLCDPCCGSGTLLIEAAMIASHLPPGFFRTEWGFSRLPGFDAESWGAKRAEWDSVRRPVKGNLVGIDRSGEAVAACKANLQAAGLTRRIEVRFGELQKESVLADLIVANPPYGHRLKGDLPPLYRALEGFIRRSKAPLAYILSGWEGARETLTLSVAQALPVLNGGLDCTLYELEGTGGA